MAMVEVSITPLGSGSPSISQFVARAIKVIQTEKDIKYELTAMGTIIEGDLPKLMALVVKMHEAVFDMGVTRVATTVKIDDRRDKPSSMKSKLASLKRKLDN